MKVSLVLSMPALSLTHTVHNFTLGTLILYREIGLRGDVLQLRPQFAGTEAQACFRIGPTGAAAEHISGQSQGETREIVFRGRGGHREAPRF